MRRLLAFFLVGCASSVFLPSRDGGTDGSASSTDASSDGDDGATDSGLPDAGTFSCQGKNCAVGLEYCRVVAGMPSCATLPPNCSSCACISKGGMGCTCSQDGSGNITETCQ